MNRFRVIRLRYRNGLDTEVASEYRGTHFETDVQSEVIFVKIFQDDKIIAVIRHFESVEDLGEIISERDTE